VRQKGCLHLQAPSETDAQHIQQYLIKRTYDLRKEVGQLAF
jgi:hypothetical protein